MNYKQFLNSSIWKKYKKLSLILFNNKCHFCENGGELHLHHTKYWGINTYKMSELKKKPKNNFRWFLLVCKNCHKEIHMIQKDKNIGVYEATKLFRSINFRYKAMFLSKKRIRKVLNEKM